MIENNCAEPFLRSAGRGRNGNGAVRSEERLLALLEEKSEWIADLDKTIAARDAALSNKRARSPSLSARLQI